MGDIFEVRKVNKDKNWMNGVGLIAFIFFTFSIVPSRPCQTRKEEKITCRCFQQREINEVCLKLLGI